MLYIIISQYYIASKAPTEVYRASVVDRIIKRDTTATYTAMGIMYFTLPTLSALTAAECWDELNCYLSRPGTSPQHDCVVAFTPGNVPIPVENGA